MTVPGLGGQQQPPYNAPAGEAPAVGVTPGVSRTVVVAQTVIVFGPSGAVVGVFVYAAGTTPGAGNGPVFWATNQTADPYGNPVTPTAGVAGTGQFVAGSTVINASGIFAGFTVTNANGIFTYGASPAAGNLISTETPAAGTDSFGNIYLKGTSAYGATFATSINGGFVTLYTGTLAGGWTAQVTIETNPLGELLLSAPSAVLTLNNTLDDGSGNASVSNTLTVGALVVTGGGQTGGPVGTGFFNTQGLASGSYGSTHQHTLPNFPTATHTHPL